MEGSESGPSPAVDEKPTTASQGASPPDAVLGGMEHLRDENAHDRRVVRFQLILAVALILGGAALATLGILLVNEGDATKLTAIVSLCTAVIGAGAALLPTGAAAGAAAGILTRSPTSTG
jgi:hypothetical protein